MSRVQGDNTGKQSVPLGKAERMKTYKRHPMPKGRTMVGRIHEAPGVEDLDNDCQIDSQLVLPVISVFSNASY